MIFRVLHATQCSEVNSTWLITSELANQRTPIAPFTCVEYTNHCYIDFFLVSREVISTWKNQEEAGKLPWRTNKHRHPFHQIWQWLIHQFLCTCSFILQLMLLKIRVVPKNKNWKKKRRRISFGGKRERFLCNCQM